MCLLLATAEAEKWKSEALVEELEVERAAAAGEAAGIYYISHIYLCGKGHFYLFYRLLLPYLRALLDRFRHRRAMRSYLCGLGLFYRLLFP